MGWKLSMYTIFKRQGSYTDKEMHSHSHLDSHSILEFIQPACCVTMGCQIKHLLITSTETQVDMQTPLSCCDRTVLTTETWYFRTVYVMILFVLTDSLQLSETHMSSLLGLSYNPTGPYIKCPWTLEWCRNIISFLCHHSHSSPICLNINNEIHSEGWETSKGTSSLW